MSNEQIKKIPTTVTYKIIRKERLITPQNNILEEKELTIEAESSTRAAVLYEEFKDEVFKKCKIKSK